ncbi:hypothetical protein EGR_06628 [Echinococcus granulosus]|uniref:Uncharacterized protein n=1 Tax=Echinococcus granulosus TaxID=6210 RepID=W6UYA5_ECHGR|nr:hypothetical protein EGR_06628 [Echinococcus granulosus]EUB58539.1 hypothetical protein EGR_06628 [Echinococcus granulosus]
MSSFRYRAYSETLLITSFVFGGNVLEGTLNSPHVGACLSNISTEKREYHGCGLFNATEINQLMPFASGVEKRQLSYRVQRALSEIHKARLKFISAILYNVSVISRYPEGALANSLLVFNSNEIYLFEIIGLFRRLHSILLTCVHAFPKKSLRSALLGFSIFFLPVLLFYIWMALQLTRLFAVSFHQHFYFHSNIMVSLN